jgi:hypothetical protein
VGRGTVPGGGAADRRVRPVSSAREREPRTQARVGRPEKEKVGRAQVNSRISDLFKLIQTSSN